MGLVKKMGRFLEQVQHKYFLPMLRNLEHIEHQTQISNKPEGALSLTRASREVGLLGSTQKGSHI